MIGPSPLAWPCEDPSDGGLLEGYADATLEPMRSTRFEEHLFACPGCVAELRMRQSTTVALAALEARRLAGRRWTFAALGAAAVVTLGALLWLTAPGGSADPFSLDLRGSLRGESSPRIAPAGRPLVLRLPVISPESRGRTFEVRVENAAGREVLVEPALSLGEDGSVLLRVPSGLLKPGGYSVILRERDAPAGSSAERRFKLELR